MIAVDTNVLVRLVTNDDPVQSPRAARLFVEEDVFVPWTVLLEVEWVLRGAYDLPPPKIQGAFERLMSVPSVKIPDASALARSHARSRGSPKAWTSPTPSAWRAPPLP